MSWNSRDALSVFPRIVMEGEAALVVRAVPSAQNFLILTRQRLSDTLCALPYATPW